MKVSNIILLMILILVLVSGAYILWENWPSNPTEFESYTLNENVNVPDKSIQFYPNMRFQDKRISYFVEDKCTQGKKVDIADALEILSGRTNLEFYAGSSNAEIKFICTDLPPEPEQEGHFVAGEGGPTEIVNTSLYSVILHSKVSLYRPEKCDKPQIAVHEILHALGFDHNKNKKSIMYPVTECDQELDQYITDEINSLYSINSLPDLAIEKISANKTGRYINFDIILVNYGLKDASNVKLILYTDTQKVKEFDLKNIDLGIRKSLSVQNIRGPGDFSKLVFVVESDSANEISLSNNRAEINVKQ